MATMSINMLRNSALPHCAEVAPLFRAQPMRQEVRHVARTPYAPAPGYHGPDKGRAGKAPAGMPPLGRRAACLTEQWVS